MKRLPLFMLFGLFLLTALTGCNTVHGAGQDISDTGHNIAHAAN
jgi:predicted small secreted protein